MPPKVTIGVCVKDSEKTIRESYFSIINQKFPAELFKVLVVDGCSKDKTMSIIASIAEGSAVKSETFSDQGRGLAAARQIVVDESDGKYVIFVDGDVKLFSDFVENHVKFMDKNPDVGVAFGKPMYQDGTLISSIWNLYQYATGGFSGNDATVYRSEALKMAGGFDPNIKGAGEDSDLINRIKTRGWSVSVNEKAKFFHRNRENLKDFLAERFWFGYGDHYISHKTSIPPAWQDNLIVAFGFGLKMARKAYRLTQKKQSFLIPMQTVLSNLFRWFGFYKGHIDGYGHEIE